MNIPKFIPNWIAGVEKASVNSKSFNKLNPADGKTLFQVARSGAEDVNLAVKSCLSAQPQWAAVPPVKRGLILHDIVRTMIDKKEEIAHFVHNRMIRFKCCVTLDAYYVRDVYSHVSTSLV